jgi:flagellar basal-body rod protein FlgB
VADLTTQLFGVHGAALGLREARLNVLASNLANVDTPGYKARDIDFAQALNDATAASDPAIRLSSSNAAHTTQSGATSPSSADVYRIPLQRSLDGNTVDGEYEHAAFGRAALEYRASLSFIEARGRMLMTAITGQ